MTLSVVIPSINPSFWEPLYNQLKGSALDYSYELICVGPNPSDFSAENFTYVEDFGCPSRSFQIGVEASSGDYIAFIPDDCVLVERGFKESLDLIKDKPFNHGVILMYDEGPGNQSKDPSYWVGRTHEDQRLNGVQHGWKIAPCFMYNKEYFVGAGGLDCSLEHVNLNGHGLAYFTQHKGGVMHYSPKRIFKSSWSPPTEATILFQAYLQNDKPKFAKFWSQTDAAEKYNITFDNWKDQPKEWPRRYSK